DGDEVFLLHPRAEQDAGHHRNHIAQMRDWTDETLLHIAQVDVCVSVCVCTQCVLRSLPPDGPHAFAMYCAKMSRGRIPLTNTAPRSLISGVMKSCGCSAYAVPTAVASWPSERNTPPTTFVWR